MAIQIEQQGQRVYFTGDTYSAKDRIKGIGGHWDDERKAWWVGVKKSGDAEKLVAELSQPQQSDTPDTKTGKGLPTASEPDSARVYAKVEYKGTNWYVIAESHNQGRCRICKLSGTGQWVDMADCQVIKTYPTREYRGQTTYTTLGSIRRFVADQKQAESAGVPQCAACGKRGHLIEDYEDGCMKCRACCDMPSE